MLKGIVDNVIESNLKFDKKIFLQGSKLMAYPKDAYLITPELERKFKELRTVRLGQRNRQMIEHFQQWITKKGFLTLKQKEAFDRIYELASCGKG